MKFSHINKRPVHPGLWGHEPAPVAASHYFSCPEQLWTTLSSLNHEENQWVTLIGKPSHEFLTQLTRAGISKERIRCITPHSADTALWATEQALLLNNSQIVIAWLTSCSTREQKRLQLVARNSHSIPFLFLATEQASPLH